MHDHVAQLRVLQHLLFSDTGALLHELVGTIRTDKLVLPGEQYLEGRLYVLRHSVPLKIKPQPLRHRHVPYWHLALGVAKGVRQEVKDMSRLSPACGEGNELLVRCHEIEVLNPGTILCEHVFIDQTEVGRHQGGRAPVAFPHGQEVSRHRASLGVAQQVPSHAFSVEFLVVGGKEGHVILDLRLPRLGNARVPLLCEAVPEVPPVDPCEIVAGLCESLGEIGVATATLPVAVHEVDDAPPLPDAWVPVVRQLEVLAGALGDLGERERVGLGEPVSLKVDEAWVVSVPGEGTRGLFHIDVYKNTS